ncbi:aminoacylase-1-like [Phlebotomus papatasi]|uniref:aminoacylase-1-like n=1 Tax=Phlebotomus papatasi TaxID=29031 RepID=UPI00248457FB|nr:aminoacylase-1-like [Phlebotomus papatasi]
MTEKWENNEEIKIFREYLRIPSVHPNPDYVPCVDFLRRQASSLGMDFKVFYPVNEKNPIVILSLKGSDPSLPAILLNSHMDVVPVFPEKWSHPPFSAHLDSDGKIFARGSQDMKCVGTQFLGALRALKRDGIVLKRTIHASFVPDEEVGLLGMASFVQTADFRTLNVGFALDEGIASPTEIFPVFYAERSCWCIHFKCSGTPGHGSLLHKNTAGEKLRKILDKMMDFREKEAQRLENNPDLLMGDVTTINLTTISGGVQSNIVPPMLKIGFDIRFAVDVNLKEFEQQLKNWIKEAGDGIELEFEYRDVFTLPATKLDDSNIYWTAFKGAIDELKLNIHPQVFPAQTDSRYLRQMGIPAIGFSPMNNTPVLLHDHDEFLQADVYLRGIDIFKKIIDRVANC